MTKASSGWPSRGSRTPPTDWAWPGLGLAERCISHSKGTLPDIGNLVMESLAAPPKRFPRPSADHARGIRYLFYTSTVKPQKLSEVKRESDYGGRDESKRQRAESQWIVAARPLCHLQYPVAYLKDSTRRSVEITLQGGTHDLSDARATPTTRALGGQRPLLRVGNRATGACVASSPDSDLEAFSHNPAHGSFAPLAFQPSAMTNCANQRFLSY
ncbi:hypothetical protein V6N13_130940 [Hibiscus sabdariffa]